MNSVARKGSNLLRVSVAAGESIGCCGGGGHQQVQQWRGIRVKVLNGNLDQATRLLQRKMQSSGIERLIKNQQVHHIKNSEKRVLARKTLEAKIRSREFANKMKAVLIHKVRGL